jgi:hypothetical protein
MNADEKHRGTGETPVPLPGGISGKVSIFGTFETEKKGINLY